MAPYVNQWWAEIWHGLLGYRPNPTQQPIVDAFLKGRRFILICGGERSGKSFTAAGVAGLDMGPRTADFRNEKPRTIWIVGPDYRQARPEFSYIRNAMHEGGFIASESMPENDTSAWSLKTMWNLNIETRSGADVRKLASFTVDGIILAEANQHVEESWYKARGRVGETRGWVLLVGTIEDSYPWYGRLMQAWKRRGNPDQGVSFSMPTWSNTAVYPGGYDDPEIQSIIRSLPDDYVKFRYGAEVVTNQRAVIKEFSAETHVRELAVIEDVPMRLAIDPGKNAYAVVFLQNVGDYTYVHDCLYFRGQIVHDVIPQVMQSPFWRYIDHEPKTSVIDIAGSHEYGNKSHTQIWKEMAKLDLAYHYWQAISTIDAVRLRMKPDPVMGNPLILFSDKMKYEVALDGTANSMLAEFDLFRWPSRTAFGSEANQPIDASNHAIKALGYYLLHYYGLQRVPRNRPTYGPQKRAMSFAR